MWHMGDGWGWWMLFGWLWMIGLIAVVAWAIASFARPETNREQGRRPDRLPSPLEILERRYASGEIGDDEFERMRRQLCRPPGA